MMRHSILLLLSGAALLFAASCTDYHSLDTEEYSTMVYFRNGGEQEIALYRTGEDGFYSIPICKSGFNLEGTIKAELSFMDQDAMTMYNTMNYTDYVPIPRYLYSFWEEDEKTEITSSPIVLDYGPKESVKVIKLKMKTNAIKNLMDAHPERNYVLAFQLFSAKGKVSDKINVMILSPTITSPTLNFTNPGVRSDTYEKKKSPEVNTYENRVKFNIDRNRWDFTCELEVKDAAWLEKYNAAHATDYELMPTKFYTVPTQLSFPAGTTEVEFNVTVDRKGESMSPLHNYVVPLGIKGASKPEFIPLSTKEADDYIFMVQVLVTPEQLTLNSNQIVNTFYAGPEAHPYTALLDGDEETYWASPGSARYGGWPGDSNWGFYFDIDLGADKMLDAFVLGYLPSVNAVRCPTRIKIGVSTDGVNFTEMSDVATEDMRNLTTWKDLPLVRASQPIRYIRFGVLETFINGGVQSLIIDQVDMTCEVAELRLFGAAN